jgi:hypothetical protein
MKRLCAFTMVLLVGLAYASGNQRGVTVRGETAEATIGNRKASPNSRGQAIRLTERGAPEDFTSRPPSFPGKGEPSDSGWVLVDSMTIHRLIPAGERLAVVFDSVTGLLRDTLLPDFLTTLGRQAVDLAPTWLQDDLVDNFRRVGTAVQNRYADLILNCPDKRYLDEVCFQVAHLSPATFTTLIPQLLIDNVEFAYRIDEELQYVDIVDHGDPLQGGDYYSTTRYRTLSGADTVWVEIPREIYYWWVIMPKLSDEQPTYIDGYFWREYLYFVADSGYPLLREKLAATRLFWDGHTAGWANNGAPFYDSLPAVAVVGRWGAYTKPFPAGGERPIQPIRIAQIHTGNCGEMQDLLNAAARTALLPCGSVCDINEDHVWCEIWWNGDMQPYSDDPTTYIATGYVSYEKKYGGSKNCSAIWDWRNDGLQRSVIGSYSDVCTLTVEVRDSTLRPVDGAIIRLSSEDWYGGMADCFYGVTDRLGQYTTILGDAQNYYLKVVGSLGNHNAGQIIDSASAVPGTHFFYACTLAGRLDTLVIQADTATPGDRRLRLDVSYNVGHEALYGYDCYNSSGADYYALTQSPGAIDFFVADAPMFARYLAGQPFPVILSNENRPGNFVTLAFSPRGNAYSVFSNEEQDNATAFIDVTVKAYRRNDGVAEKGPPAGTGPPFAVSPNPFRGRFSIRLPGGSSTDVRIMDRAGRLVRCLSSAGNLRAWDGADQNGKLVAPGVYFCRVACGGSTQTLPVVYLGAER